MRSHRKSIPPKQLTVRGVSPELARALDEERRRRGTSLNQTVLDLLTQALGLRGGTPDNGLAALAGTWTDEDLAEFEQATAPFEEIDPELWRS